MLLVPGNSTFQSDLANLGVSLSVLCRLHKMVCNVYAGVLELAYGVNFASTETF